MDTLKKTDVNSDSQSESGKVKLSREAAIKELERLGKSWFFSGNIKELANERVNKKDPETADSILIVQALIKDIQEGIFKVECPKEGHRLVLRHNLCEPVGEDKAFITYRMRSVGAMRSLDKYGKSKDVSKGISMISIISGESEALIDKLLPADFTRGANVGAFFFNVE
jgi:hypothetical protein